MLIINVTLESIVRRAKLRHYHSLSAGALCISPAKNRLVVDRRAVRPNLVLTPNRHRSKWCCLRPPLPRVRHLLLVTIYYYSQAHLQVRQRRPDLLLFLSAYLKARHRLSIPSSVIRSITLLKHILYHILQLRNLYQNSSAK
jgi:hypothetical protein